MKPHVLSYNNMQMKCKTDLTVVSGYNQSRIIVRWITVLNYCTYNVHALTGGILAWVTMVTRSVLSGIYIV